MTTKYDSILAQAELYSAYGPDYDRNIAAPRDRLLHAINQGHREDTLDWLADELHMRLELKAERENRIFSEE